MIVGERIRLRAIETEDLPLLVKWRNDPQIYRCFYEHEPLSLETQRRWFDDLLRRADEKFWIAETIQDSAAIGTVALLHIDWRNRRAELGRVLIAEPTLRGTGYGKEMVELTLGYAFGHLNLNRLFLDVFADNARAVKFYTALGFLEEGRLRQHVFADHKYRDLLLLSLLRNDYAARRGGNNTNE